MSLFLYTIVGAGVLAALLYGLLEFMDWLFKRVFGTPRVAPPSAPEPAITTQSATSHVLPEKGLRPEEMAVATAANPGLYVVPAPAGHEHAPRSSRTVREEVYYGSREESVRDWAARFGSKHEEEHRFDNLDEPLERILHPRTA